VELNIDRQIGRAEQAISLELCNLVDEGCTLPGFGDTAGLFSGDDVGCCFFDDAEIVKFELADDGGFAGAGCASEDESFHRNN